MSMNPRLLRPTASGFSPRSISGLALWLDASDGSTVLLNDTAVSRWNDKSGNGKDFTQPTANNQPSYANTQNGKKVVTFDGSNDLMTSVSTIALGTGGYTVFVVCFHAGGFHIMLEGGGLNPYLSSRPSGNGGLAHYDGANELTGSAGSYSLNTWFVAEFVISPASVILSVNGTQIGSGAGTSRAANISYLGGSSAGFLWNGRFAEVLIYGSALSAQRSAIRRYLGSKWGVTVV